MNRKLSKIILIVLLSISTVYGLFLLVQREQSIAFFLTAGSDESNMFVTIAALPLVMIMLAACLMMFVYLWGNHEAARKAAYLSFAAEGALSLLSNVAYMVIQNGNVLSLLPYLAGSAASIAAGVFLIASIRKCGVPWIVLICLCCAAFALESWEALLLEIPFILACMLSNISTPEKKPA